MEQIIKENDIEMVT
jgi:sodium/bile acid cotransporter 7